MNNHGSDASDINASDFAPEALFSVPFWSRMVVDSHAINQQLMVLQTHLEETTTGAVRSNAGGWHSTPDLHLNSEFAQIRQIIGTTCAQCARSLNFDFDKYHLAFNEMWLNRNGPGDYNRAHVHSNAVFSGVYYIKVPAGSGNLELYDPIRERVMTALPVHENLPRTGPTLEISGEEGKLLVFPSWLQHAVQTNRSSEARVSLSFNMIARPNEALTS